MANINLSNEQQYFITNALAGNNILVEACIGSGKTTVIQALCDMFPTNKLILYLTYNKLLKIDAKSKIKNRNITVTNYHGFVYPYLMRNDLKCGLSEAIQVFTENRLSIPRYDILIIDEYQDIEKNFAEMLEYIKSTNPNMQIIMVGDMAQKIYDKTTLDVANWTQSFLTPNHIELEFTQCFRLQPALAKKLGSIWNKSIIGVNPFCQVHEMRKNQIVEFLAKQDPSDVLCLGAKTGGMVDVLNKLEEKYPEKYNKYTVYASIADRDANIEPNENTAIFTTFDSSKGMEKPICIVFDWDEAYWEKRTRQPNTDAAILKNIFCVAASRGKKEIIFVRDVGVPLLTEKTICAQVERKKLKKVFTSEMFDFKYIEEVTKAYNMLDVIEIKNNDNAVIDINNADGMIDLSPCIGIYQELVFFKNYNIDDELKLTLSMRGYSNSKDLIKALSTEQKILKTVALATNQNRYISQVKTPFVKPEEHNAIMNRLATKLSRDDCVQIPCTYDLDGIKIKGICDVIKDNTVWELKFTQALKQEHFLQLAMYLIAFKKEKGILWNVKTNEMHKVSIRPNKKKEFIQQVYRTITKQR